MSRRIRLLLTLMVLAGLGIAVAASIRRPTGFFILQKTITVNHDDRPVQAAFIPGKDSVMFGVVLKPVVIFDLATGGKRELFSDYTFGSFTLSQDGASALVDMLGEKPASMEQRVYDLASGKVRKTSPEPRGAAGPVAWSPDGRQIVSAVTWMLFMRDIDRGEETRQLAVSENHSDRVNSLAFSPDGRLLGIGTWDGDVSLWRTDSWTPVKRFDLGSVPDPKLRKNAMGIVAFSPDGSLFAAGGGNFYGTLDENDTITSGALRVWRTSDLQEVLSLNPGKPVCSLSISPDASMLAYFVWGEVHVADLATGQDLWRLEARTGQCPIVHFGWDGRLLTLDGREGIRIWKRAPAR